MYDSLDDYFIASAVAGLQLQFANGAMPKGHNGPWQHSDTYVRTTAHWAIIFYRAYLIAGDNQYLKSALAACDYLLSEECRPHHAAFFCRYPTGKRLMSNGLIGQAWAVEPLLMIGKNLGREDYIKAARETINLHRYDDWLHGWKSVEIDGALANVNDTFNQQIWFCAMAKYLQAIDGENHSELGASTNDFMNHLSGFLHLTQNNYFRHAFQSSVRAIIYRFQSLLRKKKTRIDTDELEYIAIGYHSFLFYGLSLLSSLTKNHSIWAERRLQKKMIKGFQFSVKKLWNLALEENKFAYAYNPTGIEIAYCMEQFPELYKSAGIDLPGVRDWLMRQFSGHFNYENGLMDKNTLDQNILSARLYEAFRLSENKL